MPILIFIIKLIVSSGLLYGYYHLFLRNKRFHRYNRFYLLSIVLLSFIIPFINIPVSIFSSAQQHPVLIKTLKVINGSGWEEPVIIYANRNSWISWVNLQNCLWAVYAMGVLAGVFMLMRSFFWIKNLRNKYQSEQVGQFSFYNTIEPGTPFSFFNNIFWHQDIPFNDWKGQQIFRHEAYHAKERHSADILLMEIACSIAWFNPLFYIIRKEIRAIHEFLADEYAASPDNRYAYAELLVQQAIAQKNISLAHPFFHTQIKRRILMITQSNLIRRSGYISRIMALPLLFLLVSAFAVKIGNKPAANDSHYSTKNITVVIDAGHGGTFPGANNIGMLEKDINLEISKKIKQLSAEYNVSIVLTRADDKLVGNATNIREDLLNRVKIADDAKPDMFISIHVNMATDKKSTASGFEAYISGKEENPKARQFASAVIGKLKNIYPVLETIRQREEGIMVIDRKSYPAILLECGYLNNQKDAEFISNTVNQEKIARKILEGIVQYGNAQSEGTAFNSGIEQASGDTLSAQDISKIHLDDVKSLKVDTLKNLITIFLKNGDIKFGSAKEVAAYFKATDQSEKFNGRQIYANIDGAVTTVSFANDTIPDPNVVFTKVEFEADYPGGQAGWISYLTKHLTYPEKAIKKNIQGTVVVKFIVNTDGKVSDVSADSGPEMLRAESIRTIKESGNWIPAMDNGKNVKAYKKQPITFKLG